MLSKRNLMSTSVQNLLRTNCLICYCVDVNIKMLMTNEEVGSEGNARHIKIH